MNGIRLNSLRQELKKEEMGPKVNAELANVVNAMVKEGLLEEKLQEKLNKYHRPENCESLTINMGSFISSSSIARC